jgi:chromosome segregation ATPase
MTSFRIFFLIIAAAITLSGCAGKCGDPREDGLLGGLSGVYGDCYDKRLEDKNNQLTAQERRGVELKTQAMSLHDQYQFLDSKLADEQKQNAALQREIHSLDQHVARLRVTTSKQKKEAAEITARLRQMKKDAKSQQDAIDQLDHMGGSSADPEQYQRLEAERDRLRQEYKALLDYTETVEKAGD